MTNARDFLDNLTHAQLVDRLNLALDGGGLGIWDWDLRDDSVQFDRRWCEMLGLDHDRTPMMLDTWKSRVHADDLAACYADIRAHVDGTVDRYQNVHRMRHADGRWIFILDRGRISGRDAAGQPIRFTGTHLDVTETEVARQALAQHQRQLIKMVASLPVGVVMLDLDLTIIDASPRWLTELGLDASVIGGALASVAPDAFARWGPALVAAVAGTATAVDEDAVDEAAVDDGAAPRWLRWDARPWHGLDGTIGGALLTIEDVTATVRRRLEAERERDGRLAALAMFAGGIAHELNSPLQVITLEAALLDRELARAEPERARLEASVRAIAVTTTRAAAITRALRTLARDARLDAAVAVPVAELLVDLEALCRSRFASVGVGLTVVDATAGAIVWGRAAELLMILLNLLSNGHDAARAGAPWVRLEVEATATEVVFRCSDGGAGVAPAHVARLTEPYFSTKAVGAGTGLGLSIAHALAARNGGRLIYRPGVPTTFELRVPRPEPGP